MLGLTAEEKKWAHVWREAHEIAEAEMPRLKAGVCSQSGLAALLANFAVKIVKQETAKLADARDES